MLDLTETIVAKSDQLNADDLMAGEQTFTVTKVTLINSDQPVSIHLAEWPQPFKPSKTVMRILVAAWGKDGEQYAGRRMTLYRDPAVKWAGAEVGGIRVSALSHIAKPMKLMLQESKGKKTAHRIAVLADAPAPAAPQVNPAALVENIAEATTADEVKAIGNHAHAAGVLDVEVDGKPIREHVVSRLADFAATQSPGAGANLTKGEGESGLDTIAAPASGPTEEPA